MTSHPSPPPPSPSPSFLWNASGGCSIPLVRDQPVTPPAAAVVMVKKRNKKKMATMRWQWRPCLPLRTPCRCRETFLVNSLNFRFGNVIPASEERDRRRMSVKQICTECLFQRFISLISIIILLNSDWDSATTGLVMLFLLQGNSSLLDDRTKQKLEQ